MKLDSPSELGPWVRQEEQQNRQTTYLKTNHTSFKQQLILPRVAQLKPYIIKIRESKTKPLKPIKVKPLQLSIRSGATVEQTQLDPNNPRKSRTLSFDPPKISFYNKNFPKASGNTKQLIFQANVNSQRERVQNEQRKHKKQISKVDLMIEQSISDNTQELKQSYTSSKIKQREFAKKRSLMQLLKFLKSSSNQSNSDQKDQVEKANKLAMSNRYEMYRNAFNQSIQSQPRYIPYFQARKSLVYSKRK